MSSERDREGVLVVVGSGMQRYRQYLLESVATVHPVWLLDRTEPTWQRDHIAGHSVADLSDRDAVLAAARAVAASRPVLGVLSWDETLIVVTAHLAESLGLPGPSIQGIEGCRDKRRNREVLAAAGLPQPAFGWAATEGEAVELAEGIGYPAVVKPRGMGASIGVVLAGSPGEVRRSFHIAEDSSYDGAPSYQGGALVEEYLAGPEVSVDAAVVGGEYLPMFVARKQTGMFPYFEELGHTVTAGDPLLRDATFVDTLARAHRAIGFRYGITHTEVKLTTRGHVVVEINGRLGGDLIPFLGRLATGIDPGVAAARVSTGALPDLAPSRSRTVGIRFGYPPEDCEVQSVSLPEVGPVAGLLHGEALVEPGSELRLPPGGYIARHSYVICEAETQQACLERLDAALGQVELDWRPLERSVAAQAPA